MKSYVYCLTFDEPVIFLDYTPIMHCLQFFENYLTVPRGAGGCWVRVLFHWRNILNSCKVPASLWCNSSCNWTKWNGSRRTAGDKERAFTGEPLEGAIVALGEKKMAFCFDFTAVESWELKSSTKNCKFSVFMLGLGH